MHKISKASSGSCKYAGDLLRFVGHVFREGHPGISEKDREATISENERSMLS